LKMGASRVEVALARAKRRRSPTPMTWHRARSVSSKARPIKSVPSRVGEGRVEVGEMDSGGVRVRVRARVRVKVNVRVVVRVRVD
jgi:hypothetical protein